MSQAHLFHIAYSPDTLAATPPGFEPLDHSANERSDWREYWPMRKFLLNEPLVDADFYGFFSPRFKEKTGLTPARVREFIAATGPDIDVVSFSPQPDMGAFFLNVFEQEEVFQQGFLATSEAFLQAIGIAVSLKTLVMDSRQIIFSNYFAARPAFWREWLAINEKLFAICENHDSPLTHELTATTDYPGEVQRKIFVMERIAPFLLVLNPDWKVRAYNTFACAWSDTNLKQHKHEAVLSDALKIAMKEQGFPQYLEAFVALRNKLRR